MSFMFFMLTYFLIRNFFIQRDIIVYCCFVGANIVLFLIQKYFNKIFEYLVIFIFSGFGIYFVEMIKISIEQKSFTGSISLMLPFQLFSVLVLISRANWILSWISYIISVVYLVVRTYNFDDTKNFQQALLGTFIIILNFSIISYKQEKNHREYFKLLDDSNENLKQFKVILQSILPLPIFIANYQEKKLEFFNKSARKLLFKYNKNIPNANLDMKKDYSSAFLDKNDNYSLESLENIFKSFRIIEENSEVVTISKIPLGLAEIVKTFIEKECKTNDFLTINIASNDNASNNAKIINDDFSFSKIRYFELKSAKIKWENKICIIFIFNDNTNAKRLAELTNVEKYKNQMLATISHDLRTPLNGIIGMMTSVLSVAFDKESQKNLNIGIRSANLLNYLINDILDYSQIAYRKLRMNIEKVNIDLLVTEILDLISFQAKKKNLDLKLDIDVQGKNFILSDPTRLTQILLNLLGNSIKFTVSGGNICLKITNLGENITRSSIYKFSVIDTGIGIHDEDTSKLFELFGKLNQENAEINKTGIGFGLSISHNLAKMLYNEKDSGIHVESEFGKGSNFWFKIDGGHINDEDFLSINEKNDCENGELITKIKPYENIFFCNSVDIKPEPSNFRILIVDDDPVNIMIMEKYLQFFNINYVSAMNGLEAVETIKKEVIENNDIISAILMDCNMPIMDGFKATEKIQELLKKNRKTEIPIIAVTANATNADMDLCLNSGMKTFLPKPVRRKDLGETLKNLLNIKLVE